MDADSPRPALSPSELVEEQLRLEYDLLNQEYQQLTGVQPNKDLSPEARRSKLLEVTKRLRETRSEAREQGIELDSPSQVPRGPPVQSARLLTRRVSATLEGGARGSIKIVEASADSLPGGVVPGSFIARRTNEG